MAQANFRINVNFSPPNGLSRVQEIVRRVEIGSRRAAEEIVQDMYDAVHEEILQDAQTPKSGTLWNRSNRYFYRTWKNSYSKPSAAPGESPADQTGGLYGSISFKRNTATSGNLEVGAKHGYWQEFGGWTSWYGNTIAARPFVRPATERARKRISDIARARYRKETGL